MTRKKKRNSTQKRTPAVKRSSRNKKRSLAGTESDTYLANYPDSDTETDIVISDGKHTMKTVVGCSEKTTRNKQLN